MVIQDNLHVVFLELVRNKRQRNIFSDKFLLLQSQLFSFLLMIFVNIAPKGCNLFLGDFLAL